MTYISQKAYYLDMVLPVLTTRNVVVDAIEMRNKRYFAGQLQERQEIIKGSGDHPCPPYYSEPINYCQEANRVRLKELTKNPSLALPREINIVPTLLAYLDCVMRLVQQTSNQTLKESTADDYRMWTQPVDVNWQTIEGNKFLANLHSQTKELAKTLNDLVIDILSTVDTNCAQALVDKARNYYENGISSTPNSDSEHLIKLNFFGDIRETTDEAWSEILIAAEQKRNLAN